jgi:hypothetical protein
MEQKHPTERGKDGPHNVGEIVEVIKEGDLVEIVDIEIYAKENRRPPRAKKYKVRIDRDPFIVDHRKITGEELFKLAQKSPEKWRMHQKLHGGQMEEIKVGDTVDLGEPGVERFVTMELTQGDGEQTTVTEPSSASSETPARRAFRLPEEDEAYLNTLGLRWETIVENGVRWVLIHEHLLPEGYTAKTVTIAICIEGGYPPAKLDMAYFLSPLARTNGVAIRKTKMRNIDGGAYQRWSRHYLWREGIDTFATHHLHIKDWLEAEPKR